MLLQVTGVLQYHCTGFLICPLACLNEQVIQNSGFGKAVACYHYIMLVSVAAGGTVKLLPLLL